MSGLVLLSFSFVAGAQWLTCTLSLAHTFLHALHSLCSHYDQLLDSIADMTAVYAGGLSTVRESTNGKAMETCGPGAQQRLYVTCHVSCMYMKTVCAGMHLLSRWVFHTESKVSRPAKEELSHTCRSWGSFSRLLSACRAHVKSCHMRSRDCTSSSHMCNGRM